MASIVTAAATVSGPAAFPSKAFQAAEPSRIKAFVGLKSGGLFSGSSVDSEFASRSVQNGSRLHCMQTLNPYNNDKYETLSYLPPLSSDAIAKQIDYVTRSGWIPCIEFDNVGSVSRVNNKSPGYYDGRYWVMWKLPMFGCTDSAQVLREIAECHKEYPKAFIRIIGFDNVRQVQCAAFLVHRPSK